MSPSPPPPSPPPPSPSSSSLAPPPPSPHQRDIAARPLPWFLQTPIALGASFLLLRRLARRPGIADPRRYARAARAGALGGVLLCGFDVWYWRRAAAAVAARDAWERAHGSGGAVVVGVIERAPRGVRTEDGRGWVGVVDEEEEGEGGEEEEEEEELRDPWAVPREEEKGAARRRRSGR